MTIKKFLFNPFPVNTYVLADEQSKEAAVVDPGCYNCDELQTLVNYINDKGLTLKYILLTHLHLDHCFGITLLKQVYPEAVFCANEKDDFLLKGAAQQAAAYGLKMPAAPIDIERNLNQGDELKLGEQKIEVIAVPGHSPGSLCYYMPDSQNIMVGDVLFKQSIGRTDLPKGNHKELLSNIESKLFTLPAKTVVYCGHGPETTIGDEANFNPFF